MDAISITYGTARRGQQIRTRRMSSGFASHPHPFSANDEQGKSRQSQAGVALHRPACHSKGKACHSKGNESPQFPFRGSSLHSLTFHLSWHASAPKRVSLRGFGTRILKLRRQGFLAILPSLCREGAARAQEVSGDDRVAIFRLDKDQFLRQLNELKQAGDEYEAAKQELSVAVDQAALGIDNAQGASSQYSTLKELQQFGRPAHISLVTLDQEMASLSSDQEETIEDLRWSVDSFEFEDEAERQDILSTLDGLSEKFSYTSPEGMSKIHDALNS